MAMWKVWVASCYRQSSAQCARRIVTSESLKRDARRQLSELGWQHIGGPSDNPMFVCPACARRDED
jgi:hypothetical protein